MDDIENVDEENYRDQKMDRGRACDEDEAQNNHNVLIQFVVLLPLLKTQAMF